MSNVSSFWLPCHICSFRFVFLCFGCVCRCQAEVKQPSPSDWQLSFVCRELRFPTTTCILGHCSLRPPQIRTLLNVFHAHNSKPPSARLHMEIRLDLPSPLQRASLMGPLDFPARPSIFSFSFCCPSCRCHVPNLPSVAGVNMFGYLTFYPCPFRLCLHIDVIISSLLDVSRTCFFEIRLHRFGVGHPFTETGPEGNVIHPQCIQSHRGQPTPRLWCWPRAL